jgi:urease accessory protein
MIAVGLWGAQLGRPAIWLLPICFPLMMALGASLGLMGYPLPGVEMGIAVSAIVLGLLILLNAKLPLAACFLIVGFFAIFHGHAHGTELPAGQSGLLYSVGFVLSTGLLHGVGIGIGTVHFWKAGPLIIRAAGAVVLAGGLYFLAAATGLAA